MGWQKTREQRQIVFLRARMRDTDGWHDITICNISSRGLMAKCSLPPTKGAFVELRLKSDCIVGHVKWSQGMRFGIWTQDGIIITSLTAELPLNPDKIATERRTGSRSPRARTPKLRVAARAEESRRFAQIFDWSVIAIAATLGAVLVFDMAQSALNGSMQTISVALAAGH